MKCSRPCGGLSRRAGRWKAVIPLDVAQDVGDLNTLIAIEVFEDQAALDRQESLPDVVELMALFPDLLAARARGDRIPRFVEPRVVSKAHDSQTRWATTAWRRHEPAGGKQKRRPGVS